MLTDTKFLVEDKYRDNVPKFLSLLNDLDEQQAQKYHSNDRRRVVNAIFKILRDRVAEALNLESKAKKLSCLPILVRLSASEDVLAHRIRKRSKTQLERGREEIKMVFEKFPEPCFEKGIL